MTSPLPGIGSGPVYNNQVKESEKGHDRSSSSVGQKGAILAKDSLDVPLEVQFGIETDQASAGRPMLPPLFNIRMADDRQGEDLTYEYYLQLREKLSPLLQEKLTQNEAQIDPADRDADLMALDASLKFEAGLLAWADQISAPGKNNEETLISARQFVALPELVQKELAAHGSKVQQFLERYLSNSGPNDPGYDILVQISNRMKEAIDLLNKQGGAAEAA